MDEVIKQTDDLINAGKFEEAYTVVTNAIQKQGMTDPELYWRHARLCRDLALTAGKNDKAVYKKFINEGLEAAELGLKMDPSHPKCHCWVAIHLNYQSELEGIDQRIKNSFKMKEHWLEALKVTPNDAVTLHSLGRWCFEVKDLPYLKRKFAELLFGSPPTSTYEEALKYLLASEEASPGLITNNSLYLAKTYSRLKDNANAKKYCNKVLSFTADDMESEEAKREATKLLKSL